MPRPRNTHCTIVRCAECGSREVRIKDTVQLENAIKRTRECQGCGVRWNTFEVQSDVYDEMKGEDRGEVPQEASGD